MPKTRVVFYKDDDGSVPALAWLDGLSNPRAAAKCLVKIGRLKELGHELRRPEADLLRDGIHELRIGLEGINYRLLYFFHKQKSLTGTVIETIAVVSHGITKERRVPPGEIALAIKYMGKFKRNPGRHIHEE
jgi:putative component of toxin-antitoxin plasmid stabilization module